MEFHIRRPSREQARLKKSVNAIDAPKTLEVMALRRNRFPLDFSLSPGGEQSAVEVRNKIIGTLDYQEQHWSPPKTVIFEELGPGNPRETEVQFRRRGTRQSAEVQLPDGEQWSVRGQEMTRRLPDGTVDRPDDMPSLQKLQLGLHNAYFNSEFAYTMDRLRRRKS